MKIMGLDYGTKRVGVALSFGDVLAEPETILARDAELFPHLADLIATHQVQKIVLGVTDGAMQSEIKRFQQELITRFNLEVTLMDEAFSSREAAAKISSSRSPSRVDDKAAAIILQNYLDIYAKTT